MNEKTPSEAKNVNRRDFVKAAATLGAAATTLGASGSVVSNEINTKPVKAPGSDYDVIVVGGGFAGVTAARDSMENGHKTLLLEARNRLGGRTFTTEIDGVQIEFGGTWVHNSQPFVWSEIERYGLKLNETPGAVAEIMHLVLEDGLRITFTEAQFAEAIAGWDLYTAQTRINIPRPYDILHNKEAALEDDKISALNYINNLKLTPLQRAFNIGMVESVCNNTADTISQIDILRIYQLGGGTLFTFIDSLMRFQIAEGTGALINAINDDGGAEVKLSTPVKAVEDLGDKVVVTTLRGKKYTAGAVINCLPMNTIANVSFTPALPASVVAAGKQRHPGAGIKLYVKVKGDIGNFSVTAPGMPINFVMTYKQSKDYTHLVALGSGSNNLDVYDDESVEAALQPLLPGVKVLSTTSYDWNNDPYSQGTWATYRPGWLGKYHADFQKEYGRLFFATGDHGEGWRSSIDGAIAAGARAAQKVKNLLA